MQTKFHETLKIQDYHVLLVYLTINTILFSAQNYGINNDFDKIKSLLTCRVQRH